MTSVGIVGWRGMVGSVLLERMQAERDLEHFEPVFFSTSQAGEPGPDMREGGGKGSSPLLDAHDIPSLAAMDMVVSCQGGDYTKAVHGELRKRGWTGLWIDAASSLRMDESAVIILDPPAFVKDRRKMKVGLAGYRRINEAALRLLPPGGILVTCSCSGHVSMPDFRHLIAECGARTQRTVQVLESFGHGLDHPQLAAYTEADYLKVLFCAAW